MKHFGIIGFQRSGTTALLRALINMEGVSGFPWEISLPTIMAEPGFSAPKVEIPEKKLDYLATGFLKALRKSSESPQSKAWGWKTAIGNTKGIEGSLDRLNRLDPDFRLIACRRLDIVAQIGSALRANATGKWQSWEAAGRVEGTPGKIRVTIDPRYLLWLLNESERLNRLISDSGLAVHWVNFETAFTDFPATLSEILQFIGVSDLDTKAPQVRDEGKVSPPPESFINNYDELSDLLNRLRKAEDRHAVLRSSLGIKDRLRLNIINRVGRWTDRLNP